MRPPPADGRVFVGRQDAVEALAGLAAQARAGRGQVALICGEAGIGKTSLIEHVAAQFGGVLARGRSLPADDGPAYGPWRSIVGTLLDRAEHAARTPGLRSDLEIFAAGGASGAVAEGNPAAASFALSRAIGSLVRACGPALITLDDFHWADPAARRLIERFAATLPELPVLLVVGMRDAETAPETLARLLRLGTLIRLAPFSRGEALSLIDALRAPRERLDALLEASGGNPFLLTDMIVAAPASEGRAVSLAGRYFLRERLDALGADGLEVLRFVAATGQPTTLDRIAGHLRRDRVGVAELADRAVRAGVLREEPATPNAWDFVHDLYREAALDEVPAATRQQMHLEIACQLGADGEIAVGPAADVARHLLAAGTLAEFERVSLWCQRAGREAMAAADPLRAVEWYEAALRCGGGKPSGTDVPSDRLLELARAHVYAGAGLQAEQIYTQLLARARSARDGSLLGRAALGLSYQRTPSGHDNPELVELLKEALRTIGPGELSLRARLRAQLANTIYLKDGVAEGRRLARAAVADARRMSNRGMLLSMLLVQRLVLWGPDHLEGQDAVLSELLTLISEGTGGSLAREAVYRWSAQQALVRGSHRDLEIALERVRAEVESTRIPNLVAALRLLEGMRALMEGRLLEAAAAVEWVAREFPEVDDPAAENRQQSCIGQLFSIRRERGELGGLETSVRALVEEFPRLTSWRAALIVLLTEDGRPEEARAELDLLRQRGLARLPRDCNWLPTMAQLAESAVAIDHQRAAREILALLEPLPAQHVVMAGIDCWGSIARYRGILQDAVGEYEAAATSLEAALVDDTRAGNLLAVAYDQVRLARLLRAGRGRSSWRRAQRLLDDALQFARTRKLPRLLALATAVAEGTATAAPRGEAAQVGGMRRAIFRRDGTGWQLALEDRSAHLRASLGLAEIHYLLQAPGQAIPAADLVKFAHLPEVPVSNSGRAAPAAHACEANAPVFDQRARNEIRERLKDLEGEIVSADDAADLGRAESLRAEREGILEALARGLDLRGRSRRLGSVDERARVNVTRNIRSAIGQVRRVAPEFGALLDRMITTGGLCCYAPDPQVALELVLH